jgi:hypothetical protein
MRIIKEERHWKEQLKSQEPHSHDLQMSASQSASQTGTICILLSDLYSTADAGYLPDTLLDSHTPSSRFFADRAVNRQQADQVQPTTVPEIRSLLPSLPSSPSMSSHPFVDHALHDQQHVNRLLVESATTQSCGNCIGSIKKSSNVFLLQQL